MELDNEARNIGMVQPHRTKVYGLSVQYANHYTELDHWLNSHAKVTKIS